MLIAGVDPAKNLTMAAIFPNQNLGWSRGYAHLENV